MNPAFDAVERRLHALLRLQDGGSVHIRGRAFDLVNAAPPPLPKDEEEQLITRHCFTAMGVADVGIESGDNPPDCIVRSAGNVRTVEVGALYDRTAQEAKRQEEAFLLTLNEHAHLLPPQTRLGLVTWDHPAEEKEAFEQVAGYPTVVKWLAGFFINRQSPTSCFGLNQHLADRRARNLFPKQREVEQLAQELSEVVATLPVDQIHVATCRNVESPPAPVETPRLGVVDKLRQTSFHAQTLLVHNYFPLSDIAMELWHAYWHERDAILDQVRLLAEHGDHDFDEVLFADYSHRLGGCAAHRLWSADLDARLGLLGEFDYLHGTIRQPPAPAR